MATLKDIGRTPPPDLNAEVELLEPGVPPSLTMRRRTMPLRDALTIMLAKSDEERLRCGIGLHAPVRVTPYGRPVLQGYLSGPAVKELWGEPDWPAT